MRIIKIIKLLFVAAFSVAAFTNAHAQDSIAQFYRGKTVTIYIGSTSGGGFDTYARLLARFMGRYIAGAPTVVPSNMPGAGSHLVANYIYNVAPKDGTAIGAIFPNVILDAVLGDRAQEKSDPSKFNYIGSGARDTYICIVRADAQIKNFADLFNHELVVGATAGGGSTRDYPLMLNALLGTHFKVISGYPGTREILLALEKNEVAGACGTAWSSMTQQRPDWFKNGTMNVLVQESSLGLPELFTRGAPLATSFAKTAEQKQILDLVYAQQLFGRPYVVAPDVMPERVKALRDAFMATWADAELQTEAQKMMLDISPSNGQEIQNVVTQMFETPQNIIDKTKAAIAGEKVGP
jgi:tripartite-type tricarboxylate transporter receptor subunit TctC